jgi:ATP-dependent DNA ligase
MAPTGRIQTHTGLWTNSMLNASVALVNAKPAGSVATQKRFGTAKFFVFDILFTAGGESVQHLPYAQRRVLLETVVADIQAAHPDCGIHLVPSLPATVDTIKSSLDLGFEGVVIKSKAGTYKPGKRGPEWLKVKVMSTADAFVVGYAPGENGNDGFVGSLEVAVLTREPGDLANPNVQPVSRDADGVMVYRRAVGQVGNLTDEYRKSITAPDGTLKQEIYGTVVEVMAQGLGKNGRMRHAHLVRLRPDKAAFDCWDDQLEVFVSV